LSVLSELDLDYIWIGIWSVGIAVSTEQLDSSCKTEQCLVSKPRDSPQTSRR
jgi:hypothetical protein